MARKKLGDLLVEAGIIDGRQLDMALEHQKRWGGRLGAALVELGVVTDALIVRAISHQLHLPSIELEGLMIPPRVLELVPRELCERHLLLPWNISRNERGAETLHVAMSDPTNLELVDDLAFRTGKRIEVSVASEKEVELAIRRAFYGERPEDQHPKELPRMGPAHRGEVFEMNALAPAPPSHPADALSDRQLVLALVRLLTRKGLITENEWLAELKRL